MVSKSSSVPIVVQIFSDQISFLLSSGMKPISSVVLAVRLKMLNLLCPEPLKKRSLGTCTCRPQTATRLRMFHAPSAVKNHMLWMSGVAPYASMKQNTIVRDAEPPSHQKNLNYRRFVGGART